MTTLIEFTTLNKVTPTQFEADKVSWIEDITTQSPVLADLDLIQFADYGRVVVFSDKYVVENLIKLVPHALTWAKPSIVALLNKHAAAVRELRGKDSKLIGQDLPDFSLVPVGALAKILLDYYLTSNDKTLASRSTKSTVAKLTAWEFFARTNWVYLASRVYLLADSLINMLTISRPGAIDIPYTPAEWASRTAEQRHQFSLSAGALIDQFTQLFEGTTNDSKSIT